MAEGNDTPTSEQETGPDKRPPWWKRLWARTGFGDKTLWEVLQLLIVPLALAAIGFWFTVQQDTRQQRIENKRAQQAQKIEDERAKAERKLAEQRAQDEALQAYLSQMSSLLLDKDLRDSKEGTEVRTLARARTLTVLSRLDRSRKTAVMDFLVEAELVQSVKGTEPIIRLGGAELSGAELSSADLSDVELSYAVLAEADLSYADLSGADLRYADLRYADLSWANLSGADLTEANLPYASLGAANLRGADVSQADLSYADLPYAQNWTAGQLEEAYLEGTTMPDGQKFEAWRMDKTKSSPTLSPSTASASATRTPSASAITTASASAITTARD